MSNGEKQENSRFFRRVDFRHAVFYSGVHACAYLDVIHAYVYSVQ